MADWHPYQADLQQSGMSPNVTDDEISSSSGMSMADDNEQTKVNEVEKVNETISHDQTDQQENSVLHISSINPGNISGLNLF
jgi:hypothetical protein